MTLPESCPNFVGGGVGDGGGGGMYGVWGARDNFDFERENDTVGGGGGRGIPVESVLIVVVTSLCLSLFSLSTALSVLVPSVQTGRTWTLNVFFSAPTRRCRR